MPGGRSFLRFHSSKLTIMGTEHDQGVLPVSAGHGRDSGFLSTCGYQWWDVSCSSQLACDIVQGSRFLHHISNYQIQLSVSWPSSLVTSISSHPSGVNSI